MVVPAQSHDGGSAANLRPLLQVMKSGQYIVGSELDEEEFRQQERDAGRTLRRLKSVPLSDDPFQATLS